MIITITLAVAVLAAALSGYLYWSVRPGAAKAAAAVCVMSVLLAVGAVASGMLDGADKPASKPNPSSSSKPGDYPEKKPAFEIDSDNASVRRIFAYADPQLEPEEFAQRYAQGVLELAIEAPGSTGTVTDAGFEWAVSQAPATIGTYEINAYPQQITAGPSRVTLVISPVGSTLELKLCLSRTGVAVAGACN